ncbi:MAG TPA: prepilin peptidase [Candidatus Methylomirabilis sp.]|nr:prepilin peptidase [Candidatus Methylomirabilis sp.]
MLIFFLIFAFLLGAVIGSFTNCFVWRLHENETLLNRSYCPKCREQIAWYDNIPVLSFVILRGRCRHCGKPISWQYPLVELATAILFAVAFYLNLRSYFPDGLDIYSWFLLADDHFLASLIKQWLVIFAAMAIFVYDWRWYLIPDSVALPAALFAFLLNLYLGADWLVMIYCVLIGGGFFLAQFLVSRGKWVGGGDVRLGILLGAVLGRYDLLILALVLTYFIGSAIGLSLVAIGKKHWSSKLPLGVFLVPGLLVAMFWGQSIVNWYLKIIL